MAMTTKTCSACQVLVTILVMGAAVGALTFVAKATYDHGYAMGQFDAQMEQIKAAGK